jgi:GrpB-like predicted nucleotidyltransferase (UPF0157 family)
VTEWFDAPKGDAPVVVAADPSWPDMAQRWIERLRGALGPVDARIEHVGSTAVVGLAAKPVIDLQVAVPSLDDEAAYRPALESLGLVLRARAPDHLFFRPPAWEPRTMHVHVCAQGSAWERDHVRFRNLLREDSALAEAYAQLKRELAGTVGGDRVRYAEGKAAFIAKVLEDDR